MASASHVALSHLLLLFLIHECQSCPIPIRFDCPNYVGKKSLDYPFTTSDLSDCGVCFLTCKDDHTMINFKGNDTERRQYKVLDTISSKSARTIVVAYPDDVAAPCEAFIYSEASLPITSSVFFTILQGFETFINCPFDNRSLILAAFGRPVCQEAYNNDNWITYGPYNDTRKLPRVPSSCSLIQLPKLSPNGNFSIQITLSYQCKRCVADGGRCEDRINGDFECHHKTKGKWWEVVIYSAFSGLIVFILVLTIYWQRRISKGSSVLLLRKKFMREHMNFETILENYAHLTPKRYTHSNIKKMTNSFKEKLGEGGFGGVYKGKLLDGSLVAVKLLKNSKEHDGEGFINEVSSIGRTNHVNIVTLLGFCYEGNKRALVYEYMANGSLEKYMHGEATNAHSLPIETLYQIVLGIARGLDYLHRGCKTRILHFDIKPHNILLDEKFCPKISDFGLAKLTPQDKQSKISMSGTRGTVGYIAPEVFCRTFGDVSHKSDVYSYGMMVLEVLGSFKKSNSQVEHSSELHFPEYIYKQLEQEDEVETEINMNENEKQLKRKMIVVSLWCTQPAPSSRPSMTTVVQMLEGSPEAVDIPPIPTYSSPPRSQWDSSTSSI